MKHRCLAPLAMFAAAAIAPEARAQFQIDWYTIDGGGGSSAGSGFSLTGTIGQPDTGAQAGGGFECDGGFWGTPRPAAACYANCDASTTPPILNIADFICFQSSFAAGNSTANCDGSTAAPVLNIADFVCFQAAFAAGCP